MDWGPIPRTTPEVSDSANRSQHAMMGQLSLNRDGGDQLVMGYKPLLKSEGEGPLSGG